MPIATQVTPRNAPDSTFPDIERLTRFFDSPRLIHRKKPRLPVHVRDVKKVRITIQPHKKGFRLTPQYKTRDWADFYKDREIISVLVRRHRAFGVEMPSSARVKTVAHRLKEWLEDWLKDNHCRATFEKPARPLKAVKEKAQKKLEEVAEEDEVVLKTLGTLTDMAIDNSLELSLDDD